MLIRHSLELFLVPFHSGEQVSDKVILLSALLANGINLGLIQMADAIKGMSLLVKLIKI
ncbi:hypothetical protein ANSO36C_35900 [Nostoc cf. commune SO-36]|uniref:Tn3 transposase DDE domain-containing protein n=1 Tax=Nostoc cf. commune SO-36 TaxID=449208 RepID=A0ABM7Z451_NOSCO|nr:hypothetical protein ANSO36C_35900 [Nostoc cf. commune SO-36]